jgi:hypothetical protein
LFYLDQLKSLIKQGEPKNAIPEQGTDAGVLHTESAQPGVNVGLPEVGQGNAEPQVTAGNVALQEAPGKSAVGGAGTTGIAHRVSEVRGVDAPRGEGISSADSVTRGRRLLANGFDPEKAVADFNSTKSISADAMAAVRAHGEELARASNQATDKFGENSAQAKAAWDAERAWIEKVKPMQTEWHKIGQAQQGEVAIDTGTFHGLRKAFFESTGKDFTPSQAETAKKVAKGVADSSSAVETAKQKLFEHTDERDAEASAVFERLMDEIRGDRKAAIKSGKLFGDLLSERAARSMERIKLRMAEGRTFSNPFLDPEVLIDHINIGADLFAKGAKTVGEWSGKMVKILGEKIRPYLPDLFDKSKQFHDANEAAFAKPAKPAASVLDKAKANAGAGNGLNYGQVFELAREKVNAGVEGLGPVMKAVHADLEPLHPGLTERQVRDAFTEYGKIKIPSQDADLTKLREYRRLGQLVSAIEDANSGKAPEKTGGQRDKPTQEIRDKTKELKQAMRDNGIETTTPEQQLASTNQARETALKNQIEDLERQLKTGEKPTQGKPVADSPTVTALKTTRDGLKAQLKAIEDAKIIPKTDAELSADKLAQYKNAIAKRTKEINDRISSGNYDKPASSPIALDTEANRLMDENMKARQVLEDARGDAEINSFKAGSAWTPEQAKALWRSARTNYLDKGVNDFNDIRHGLAGDYGIPVSDITKGLASVRGTRELTNDLYAKMQANRRITNQAKSWLSDAKNPAWINVAKSVPGFFFNLITFGHGTVGMITHGGPEMFDPTMIKQYWTNFGKQFKLIGLHEAKVFGGPGMGAYHERLMQDLVRDPNFITAKRAGLANDPFKYQDDYQNAGVVKAFKDIGLMGNRGFDGLKLFRQDMFNKRWAGLPDALKTPDMAKYVADMINHATGVVQSSVGSKSGNWLLFAPKLEASRWAFLLGDPAKTSKTFINWKNETPEARNAALAEVKQKALLAGMYFGALAINQGLLSATGSDQKVNFTNPRRGDWLSFKVNGYNLGIISPLIGTVRFLANLIHDASGDRSKFEAMQSTRFNEAAKDAAQYARGKLSPFARIASDSVFQSDFMGRPMPWSNDKVPSSLKHQGITTPYGYGEYASQNLTPIPISAAMREVWKSQGMNDDQVDKWIKALTIGGVEGVTGARLAEDNKAPDRPPVPAPSPLAQIVEAHRDQLGIQKTPPGAYGNIRTAIEGKDDAAAIAQITKLLDTMPVGEIDPGKVARSFKQSLMRPATGTKAGDAKLATILTPEEVKTMDAELAKRSETLNHFNELLDQAVTAHEKAHPMRN